MSEACSPVLGPCLVHGGFQERPTNRTFAGNEAAGVVLCGEDKLVVPRRQVVEPVVAPEEITLRQKVSAMAEPIGSESRSSGGNGSFETHVETPRRVGVEDAPLDLPMGQVPECRGFSSAAHAQHPCMQVCPVVTLASPQRRRSTRPSARACCRRMVRSASRPISARNLSLELEQFKQTGAAMKAGASAGTAMGAGIRLAVRHRGAHQALGQDADQRRLDQSSRPRPVPAGG